MGYLIAFVLSTYVQPAVVPECGVTLGYFPPCMAAWSEFKCSVDEEHQIVICTWDK